MRYHIISFVSFLTCFIDYFNAGQYIFLTYSAIIGYVGLIAYFTFQLVYQLIVVIRKSLIVRGRIIEVEGDLQNDKDVFLTILYKVEEKEYLLIETVPAELIEKTDEISILTKKNHPEKGKIIYNTNNVISSSVSYITITISFYILIHYLH